MTASTYLALHRAMLAVAHAIHTLDMTAAAVRAVADDAGAAGVLDRLDGAIAAAGAVNRELSRLTDEAGAAGEEG